MGKVKVYVLKENGVIDTNMLRIYIAGRGDCE